MDEKNRLRKAIVNRKQMDADNRHFKYDETVVDSWKNEFNYTNQDIKLVRWAQDKLGAISDCYLMYPVAMMGICDLNTACLFLKVMRDNAVGGQLMDVDNTSAVKSRMRSLVGNGFLFRNRYSVFSENTKGEVVLNDVTLFSMEKEAQTFMNRKLAKRTVLAEWIQVRPMFELIGWAAANYCMVKTALESDFEEFKQGIFSTKVIGTVFIPSILKLRLKTGDYAGELAYVGFLSAFYHHDYKIQLRGEYEKNLQFMIETIRQYFYFRDSKNKIARIVITCEDNADLVEVTAAIHSSGLLKEDYNRIFFTGEGIMRVVNSAKDAYLCMVEDASKKEGYSILAVEPDFL